MVLLCQAMKSNHHSQHMMSSNFSKINYVNSFKHSLKAECLLYLLHCSPLDFSLFSSSLQWHHKAGKLLLLTTLSRLEKSCSMFYFTFDKFLCLMTLLFFHNITAHIISAEHTPTKTSFNLEGT